MYKKSTILLVLIFVLINTNLQASEFLNSNTQSSLDFPSDSLFTVTLKFENESTRYKLLDVDLNDKWVNRSLNKTLIKNNKIFSLDYLGDNNILMSLELPIKDEKIITDVQDQESKKHFIGMSKGIGDPIIRFRKLLELEKGNQFKLGFDYLYSDNKKHYNFGIDNSIEISANHEPEYLNLVFGVKSLVSDIIYGGIDFNLKQYLASEFENVHPYSLMPYLGYYRNSYTFRMSLCDQGNIYTNSLSRYNFRTLPLFNNRLEFSVEYVFNNKSKAEFSLNTEYARSAHISSDRYSVNGMGSGLSLSFPL
jgi:hypothetical protein